MEILNSEEPSKKKRKLENGSAKANKLHENGEGIQKIRIGSRKSQLALFQTNFVADLLRNCYCGISYDIVSMSTIGDKILDVALSKIGEKSLFTKELEVALEKQEVHMVVHSLKDLPTTLPEGMVIGAICKRENPSDVVVFKSGNDKNLKDLPDGSTVGTSSLRRIAQLKRLFPNLTFESIRGNLNTRFRKLDEDNIYSAIILAAAGVIRLDAEHRIGQILTSEECMYAVGQGALAIECRENDSATIKLLSKISDEETTLCCIAERSFMKTLEGGCSVPIGVHSKIEQKKLTLKGGVFSLDGSKSIIEEMTSEIYEQKGILEQHYAGIIAPHLSYHLLSAAESLGRDLAELLLKKGAGDILKEARTKNVLLPPPSK
ncbi:porphobilinogen deaminase [Caerostris darwini]|uniref:hydroxymethylbilane synthase n=1 Tax=Caerostris darwini TaxID=1538125 RepID=A0AAV4TRR0_9ARAC|nr:porphobilinogen deaminase [Caerostris darwini]